MLACKAMVLGNFNNLPFMDPKALKRRPSARPIVELPYIRLRMADAACNLYVGNGDFPARQLHVDFGAPMCQSVKRARTRN